MRPHNPRNSMPKNVSNMGSNMKNNGPMQPMGTQPFMSIPNQFVPMQNNQMGFPMSAPVMFPGQGFPGFLPQFNGLNMNNGAVFPNNGSFRPNMNQMNLSQPAVQFQNMQNLVQLMNQGMGMPNGQLGMQNMNQFCAMQMAALAQLGSFNIPVSNQMMGSLNQGNTYRDPQNQSFGGTASYGAACSDDGRGNQINLSQPSVEQKELPNTPDKLESDAFPPGFYHPPNEGHALTTIRPIQGNSVSNGQSNMPNSWKQSPNSNFRDRPKNGRWENPKFTPNKNGKRKFDGPRDNGNRGGFNGKQRNYYNTTVSNQESPDPKRSLSMSYTEEEIQKWRDQRRKHHPSRAIKDELHKENLTGDDSFEREKKLRREQLKEVLAKQAELGVEVAEIPSHYLVDHEKLEEKITETDSNMKDRFRNKRNKQGRNKNRNQFAKRQHITNNESSNGPSSTSREPSLLQKLLSADIKRDKQHLLQVFRFMAMNNLLKDDMDKPLQYPIALVKDTTCEGTTFKDEIPVPLNTSPSLPGILMNDVLGSQDCDHESVGEMKVVNWNCGGEALSAMEEGEIMC